MAALLELLDFANRQEDRERERQREEVRLEAERRTANKIAEREGQANALRKSLDETSSAMEDARLNLEITQRQWADLRNSGQSSQAYDDQYSNAVKKLQGDLAFQQSKYRVLTMQRGHLDGTLNKTVAESSKPMFDDIFKKNKDPYDQIEEERTTKATDTTTGVETQVTQKGPASAFSKNAYAPATTSNVPSVTSQLGFTPSGFEDDSTATTPEFRVRGVRNTTTQTVPVESGMQDDAANAMAEDYRQSTQESVDQASVRKEAEAILKNPNIPPEKKQQVRERAAKLGVTL